MSHFDEGRKYKTSLLKRFAKAGVVLLFIEAPTYRISEANLTEFYLLANIPSLQGAVFKY